jgi:DNA-binding NarL/FixJ family response regulator
MKQLGILVADDHDVVRRGITSLIESQPGWKVCDEARSGLEAAAKAEEQKPEIVILDRTMLGKSSLGSHTDKRFSSLSLRKFIFEFAC